MVPLGLILCHGEAESSSSGLPSASLWGICGFTLLWPFLAAEGGLQSSVLTEPQVERKAEAPLFTFYFNLEHFFGYIMRLSLRYTNILYTTERESNSTLEDVTHPDASWFQRYKRVKLYE